MREKSNILILDPHTLIQKVRKRYGNNPIFPKKVEEAKANLHLYNDFIEKSKS